MYIYIFYGLAYGETRAELSLLIDRIFSACYLLLSYLLS